MKLLLVEDDEALARIIVRVLSTDGHNVNWESDGEAGLTSALLETYDCLVLDWMLPRISGIDICQELRRRKNIVPILILTARGEVDSKVTGLESGADDYLTKPFEIDELCARVRALARRAAINRGQDIILGNLRIDLSAQIATVQGKEVALTKQEYSLLEALARYQGRTLSREFVLSSIWNAEDTLANSVDVHIATLRRKLGSFEGLPTIRTVHREGYRLTSEEDL